MPLDQTTISETTRMLLDAAAEVRKGWCQYALEHNGNVCMWAAIRVVSDGTARDSKAISATAQSGLTSEVGKRLVQYLNTPIVNWNNAPGRTQEEVAQALEAAAFMKN